MNSAEMKFPYPDIIDYSFFDRPSYIIDLNGKKNHFGHLVSVVWPEIQVGAGRPNLAPIEQDLRDAMCLAATQAYYGLQGLNINASKARDLVHEKIPMHFKNWLKIGRRVCADRLNINSVEEFEDQYRSKYKKIPHLIGIEKFKHENIKKELADIQPLSRAYRRAQEINSGLREVRVIKCDQTKESKMIETLVYRPAVAAPDLPEGLLIAMRSMVNPVLIWQGQWLYRHIYEIGIAIGYLHSGFRAQLTASQLYVLYRMCNGDLPQELDDISICKDIIRYNVEIFGGLDYFIKRAEEKLFGLHLLTPPPASAIEMEFRGSLLADCVLTLHPL